MRRVALAASLVASAAVAQVQRADPPPAITVAAHGVERRVPVRADRGYPVVNAAALAGALRLDIGVMQRDAATLSLPGTPVTFTLETAFFRAGGEVYVLANAAYAVADTVFLPLQWVTEFLPRLAAGRISWDASRTRLTLASEDPARPAASAAVPHRRRSVAIDPGHGGPDQGMSGPMGHRPFLLEKDVTLAVSRYLASELERRGINAFLTRTRDTLISLADRGRIAGARGADVFVSLHVNAAEPRWPNARTARGVETYYLAEARTEDARRVARMENESVRFETTVAARRGDPLSFILNDLAQNEHLRESSRLAELVQGAMARVHPGEDRGVKQAGFMVLATTYMPAILVELGFGSNADEARYLTSAAGQRELARAIAEGLERYVAEYERRLAR